MSCQVFWYNLFTCSQYGIKADIFLTSSYVVIYSMKSQSKLMTKQRYIKVIRGLKAGESIGKSMLKAGYSPATANNPQVLTESKTFKELLDEIMPEEFVLDQHKRLYSEHRHLKQIRLESTDDKDIKEACKGYENISVIKKPEEGYTLLIINEVDKEARKSAVELAHKLRGSFAPTRIELKREYEDVPDEQLIALIQDKGKE